MNGFLQCLFALGVFGLGSFTLILFVMVKSSLIRQQREQDQWGDLTNIQMGRNAELISIIYKIGKPDSNGRYSDEKMELWYLYKQKDEEYEMLWEEQVNAIIYG